MVLFNEKIKNYITPQREISAEFDKPNRNCICWIIHKLQMILS